MDLLGNPIRNSREENSGEREKVRTVQVFGPKKEDQKRCDICGGFLKHVGTFRGRAHWIHVSKTRAQRCTRLYIAKLQGYNVKHGKVSVK